MRLWVFDDEEEKDSPLQLAECDGDDVMMEVGKWKAMTPATINGFKDKETGMINEFALLWAKRDEFPLHFFVFKQTASHLPHEGNVEQIFSLGGRLSDPNIDPGYLASLVFMGSNMKVYMPPVKDIWQRCLRKFTKNGKACELLENADLGLTGQAPAPAPAPAPVPAPAPAPQ